MTVPSEERGVVRDLATKVAELASGEANQAVLRRWRDVNALRRADRAPVWCRPVACWDELLSESALRCTCPDLRGVERGFRQILIKNEIGDDSPLDPFFPVGTVFDCEPQNVWGVDIGHHEPGVEGGAWGYDPPLKSPEDLDRLVIPRFTYNPKKTDRRLAEADELLGDILPVKRVCGMQMTATLGNYAAELRGLSEMMMDMAVSPELMHRIMAHIRDAVLESMRTVAATGLLTPNNSGPMVCSDPVGEPGPDGATTFANMWCQANSQEFDQVSPRMWEEFCLAYQRPILEQFGHVAYGCCENLTHKIDGVLSIPNLRIFVCSAWSDLDRVVERVGSDHVIMWRQKASDVVFASDEGVLRRHLDEGLRKLQGCHVQIVLRELQTLNGNADRLHVWTRLAREAASKYA